MSTVEQHPVFREGPAIMPSMEDEVYFADNDAISNSMLKFVAANKIVTYHSHFVSRALPFKEPTRQMELGTAIHACILEGKSLDDVLRVIPPHCLKSNGAINPGPTNEFRDSLPPGCSAVKQDEFYGAMAAVNAIRARIGKLLDHPNTLFERVIYWTDAETGMRCRMKADIIVPIGDKIVIPDLKTCENAKPSEFRHNIIRGQYWLQSAHYREGVRAWAQDVLGITSPVIDFRFFAAERDGLCQCSENIPNDWDIEQAAKARDRHMRRLADCYERNEWIDPWEQEPNFYSLPDHVYGNGRT